MKIVSKMQIVCTDGDNDGMKWHSHNGIKDKLILKQSLVNMPYTEW